MKAGFLISQLGRPAWRALFSFRPYDYGPFDRSVYRSLEALVDADLLLADSGGRYP